MAYASQYAPVKKAVAKEAEAPKVVAIAKVAAALTDQQKAVAAVANISKKQRCSEEHLFYFLKIIH